MYVYRLERGKVRAELDMLQYRREKFLALIAETRATIEERMSLAA
jgi:hypothetical protein